MCLFYQPFPKCDPLRYELSWPHCRTFASDNCNELNANINTGRVLGLRRLVIADEEWGRAMMAIGDTLQLAGSKS